MTAVPGASPASPLASAQPPSMLPEFTLEELAIRTADSVTRLKEWYSLGLFGTSDAQRFNHEDVERVRLIQLLLRRGIGLDAIVNSAREGYLSHWFDEYLGKLFPGEGRPAYSLAQAAERCGLDIEVLRPICNTIGLEHQGGVLSAADVEMLESAKLALAAGFPENALLQLLRAWADALGQAAEASARLFHLHVHAPLVAAGMPPAEALTVTDDARNQLDPLLEPAILYFHRKGVLRVIPDDMVLHVEEEAGLSDPSGAPGEILAAVVFVDLSSFTLLSTAMGDLKAAEVLERFGLLVHRAADHWQGRVVKHIGDGSMLVFAEPRSAVACAVEIEKLALEEPQFPAVRSGVHWGRMLYREGDYIGTSVNIAARLAGQAKRHQVLVTAAVWRAAAPLAGVDFVRVGRRRLKGLAEDMELFEARSASGAHAVKTVDPVCGMELGPGEAAARLSLDGTERLFCSQDCLRQFVAAPERYGAAYTGGTP